MLSALGDFEAAIECARLSLFCSRAKAAEFRRAVPERSIFAYAYEAAGFLDAAQNAYDEAAGIARHAQLHWEGAHALARAAWIALLRGDGRGAGARLMQSLSSNDRTPWLDITRAATGITIGLAVGDEKLIETFADESWLTTVLASRDAYSIGRTLYAFYELARARGDLARATELCAIALERCASADCLWPMFSAIARHGDEDHIERARDLLEAFPYDHPVAAAQHRLFEAVLAERRGEGGKLRNAAARHTCCWTALRRATMPPLRSS